MSLPPVLAGLLRAKLRRWQSLTDEIHELTAKRDAIRSASGELLEEAGRTTVHLDGYVVALVPPGVSRSVKAEKLLAAGVSPATVAEATVETPRKGYVSIMPPKEGESVVNG